MSDLTSWVQRHRIQQREFARTGDSTALIAEERRRERDRAMNASQDATITVQVPVAGTAGSAVSWTRTNKIWFHGAFRPQQATMAPGRVYPVFHSGFDIHQKGVSRNEDTAGLVGHAAIHEWLENGDGYITGVVCRIGVVNMSDGVTSGSAKIPFEGFCTLSFTGAIIPTLDYVVGSSF